MFVGPIQGVELKLMVMFSWNKNSKVAFFFESIYTNKQTHLRKYFTQWWQEMSLSFGFLLHKICKRNLKFSWVFTFSTPSKVENYLIITLDQDYIFSV